MYQTKSRFPVEASELSNTSLDHKTETCRTAETTCGSNSQSRDYVNVYPMKAGSPTEDYGLTGTNTGHSSNTHTSHTAAKTSNHCREYVNVYQAKSASLVKPKELMETNPGHSSKTHSAETTEGSNSHSQSVV